MATKHVKNGIGLSLAGLVLIAVLPILIFASGVAWMIVDQKKNAVAIELADKAQAIRVAVDQELLNQFTAMEILAIDVSVDIGNLAAFANRARRVIDAHGDWYNVVLIDPQTYSIVASALPLSVPPPSTSFPADVDQVVRTHKPRIVGLYATDQIVQIPNIFLMAPVTRGSKVRFVLAVVMNPKPLSDIFELQRLDSSWTGTVVDSHMTMAGRSREPEHYVGAQAPSTMVELVDTGESAMFRALDQQGANVYMVFNRSPITDWAVVIGIPASDVEGPIQRLLMLVAVVGGTLIASALLVTWLVGQGIARRRKDYEQALHLLNRRLQDVLAAASEVAIIATDPDGIITVFNCGAENMLGYSAQELLGRQNPTFFHLDDEVSLRARELTSELGRTVSGHRTFTIKAEIEGKEQREWTYVRKDKRQIVVSLAVTPMYTDERAISGYLGVAVDITERRQVEQHLRIAATTFESQEGMVVTDADSVILRVNQAFSEITGYSADEAVGRKTSLLKSGRHDQAYYSEMWKSINEQGAWQGEIWNRRKNGEIYLEWLTITAVKTDTGDVSNYVATLSDITLRKEAEDEIKLLAFYDPLTRLPNRRLLLDRLRQALASTNRSQREGALLFIDLDNFKTLNDTLGHDIGDILLQQVAQRITDCVRGGDTVARLGGDEFVVMLEDLSSNLQEAVTQTETVGEKILAQLNQPFFIGGHERHSTPSIGATLFHGRQLTVEELLKRADLAMYQAKAAGRNTMRFFDPGMQASVTSRAALETDIRHGLREDQFLLYYQPQVDAEFKLIGAEALVRWQHPERGVVSPAEFIPLAEETGLILPLGAWVLEAACRQLSLWSKDPKTTHLTLAVNVSAKQFRQSDFVDQISVALSRAGADPRKLKLELTESLFLADIKDVIAKMTALKATGVCFSLDDFGTGYSSLSYLKRLPLDQLKIDKSFVEDVLTDINDGAIAQTIIALGQTMGLAVIAEGVETKDQCDFLSRLGCNAYQGYFFSRPLPMDGFDQFALQLSIELAAIIHRM